MARTDTVRDWLKALGVLTATSMSPADAKAKIAAYAPMLAAEYADWCFTNASLAACAKALRFFPAYGELAAALSEWRHNNTPPGAYDKPRIAGPTGQRDDAAAERLDREWWTARIDAIASLTHPVAAVREASGMLETLTRPAGTIGPNDPGAMARPWALDRLRRIRDNAQAAVDAPEYLPRAAE